MNGAGVCCVVSRVRFWVGWKLVSSVAASSYSPPFLAFCSRLSLLLQDCIVCQEVYAVGDKLVRLPCDHFYHEVPRLRLTSPYTCFFGVQALDPVNCLHFAGPDSCKTVHAHSPTHDRHPAQLPVLLRVPSSSPLLASPQACLLKWLKLSNTCPYCRRELPSSNEAAERARRARQAAGGVGEEPWQAFFD